MDCTAGLLHGLHMVPNPVDVHKLDGSDACKMSVYGYVRVAKAFENDIHLSLFYNAAISLAMRKFIVTCGRSQVKGERLIFEPLYC